MSTTNTVETRRPTRHRMPASLIALIALLGLLAIGATQGGVAMVSDPITPLGMSTEYLEETPIDTYLLAGWFLLGIAAASVVTIVGLVFRPSWDWATGITEAVGLPWPLLGSVATGTVLLAFEVIELFMVPFHPVMHPLLIAVSLALIALPLAPPVRRAFR